MNEIAVVTAVTGGYDHLGVHEYNDDVDYIFYTDGIAAPIEDRWEVLQLPLDFTDNLWKLAKVPKINPHQLGLDKYKYVIWIDGSMQIKSHSFVYEILSFLDGSGLVLSPHFDGRDCGYGEATIRPLKYANEDLDGQVAAYHNAGFPEHYGLWECGVQARDMTVDLVREFGQTWMNEIMTWTVQDQVSCGYSLWKTGLTPVTLPKSWREYNWIHLNAHKVSKGD